MWCILHSAYVTKLDPSNNKLTKVVWSSSVPTLFSTKWVSVQVPSQSLQMPCTRTWWAANVEWLKWNTIASIPLDILQCWKPPKAFMVVHPKSQMKIFVFLQIAIAASESLHTNERGTLRITKPLCFFTLKLYYLFKFVLKTSACWMSWIFLTFTLLWQQLLQELSKNC